MTDMRTWGARAVVKGAAFHENVGRMVIYRTGWEKTSQKPAVILGQTGEWCDLAVFTYDYGTVAQLGARLVEGEPAWNSVDGSTTENICWLVR